MSDQTKIEWTDATWNVITGCDIESPGCTNCYAMKLAGTRLRNHPSRAGLTKMSAAGPVWTGEVRFNEQWLKQPLQWKRPRMIFPVAHGDMFHEAVPFEWLDSIFAVMALTKHTFQALTKRTARAATYVEQLRTRAGILRLEKAARALGYTFEHDGMLLLQAPLRNVWIGTSVENQRYADVRRGPLQEIADRGWLTWVSYEPALGPVDWTGWEFLRWMVSGGESGADARPSHPDWHRAARDFCAAHGIAFNFKQWGAWLPRGQVPSGDPEKWTRNYFDELGIDSLNYGKKAAGRLLDGVQYDGFPEVRS